ncbi:MAG TPA: hypothetical protein PKM84_00740 [Candidatus Pacearchaeota archaeon]|nr:hypothetical protein [Candidatus Pacearchaeota archaeon]
MGFAYEKQWKFLMEGVAEERIFNAYFFYGPLQTEKIAINFIKAVNLPQNRIGSLEYKIIDRERLEQIASSNILIVSALKEDNKGIKKKGNEITIGQIREIQNFASLTAFAGGYKAVIIREAHLLNEEAQNALLKILEEPKGKVIFILVGESPERLLPTVLSRCAKIFFPFEESLFDEEMERKAIEDLNRLMRAGLAQRFGYAKDILRDAEKSENYENLKKIFFCWMGALRGKMMDIIGYKNASKCQKDNLQRIINAINKLQEAIFLLEKTNINPKLNLEIFLLEL